MHPSAHSSPCNPHTPTEYPHHCTTPGGQAGSLAAATVHRSQTPTWQHDSQNYLRPDQMPAREASKLGQQIRHATSTSQLCTTDQSDQLTAHALVPGRPALGTEFCRACTPDNVPYNMLLGKMHPVHAPAEPATNNGTQANITANLAWLATWLQADDRGTTLSQIISCQPGGPNYSFNSLAASARMSTMLCGATISR